MFRIKPTTVNVEQGNPVFDYEARHIRQGRGIKNILEYSVRWALYGGVLPVVFWLIAVVIVLSTNSITTGMEVLYQATLIMALLGFADKLVLDFIGLWSGITSISGDVTAGRIDLVRLTGFPAERVIQAKHAVAQVRAWRVLMLVVGWRVTVVLLGALSLLIDAATGGTNSFGDPYAVFVLLPGAVIIAGIYTLEPFWRMRSLTAASIAVSSQMRDPTMALLSAFGVFLATWALQIILAVASGYLIVIIGPLFDGGVVGAFLGTLVWCGVLWVAIYGIYSAIERMWIRRATARILRMD